MKTHLLSLLILCLPLASLSAAKDPAAPDASILTLQRIYDSSEFSAKSFDGQWAGEGHAYTKMERTSEASSGEGIVQIDAETGEKTVLVDASLLVPSGESKPLSVASFSFSHDRSLVLIYTNTRRVWRHNTRGDYWVLDRSARVLKKLGGDRPASSLMFAKFSPDAQQVAYIHANHLVVEHLLTGEIRQLTKSDNPNVICGTSDWVNEEELGIRDGFRWSPDGTKIAFWRFDTTGVERMTMIDNTNQRYPKTIVFPYPKTGRMNSSSEVGVVDLASGKTRIANLPGDAREHYIARMSWRPGSGDSSAAQRLIIQRLNRRQNENRIYSIDENLQSVQQLLVETDETWVDVHDEMFWMKDQEHFTWISERDGWRHIYLASSDGLPPRCLTPGSYDVIELLGIDEDEALAYFIASPSNATQRYLYRIGLDGKGLTKLSPKGEVGTHDYQLSADGKFALHTFSNMNTPPVTDLVALPSHERVRMLTENKALAKNLKALKRKPAELFQVRIGDGVKLDAYCIEPPKLSPKKKYPLLIYVYGEPAGTTVRDRWGGSSFLWHQMLAQQGYVVMSIDNRGTPAPRGRAWRKGVYKNVGIHAPIDQAAAVRRILKDRPYLDACRVGVWGWSGGGSMSLNAIFRYPDLYSTAISIAPVPNQRYYDTIYQERYMGLPSDNPDGYRNGSPITHSAGLKGNLLLIHGTGDDNCHYATMEMLIDQLIKQNKQFDMMSYPNRTHSIREGKNTTLHLRSLMTRYLHDHLPVNE